METILGFTAIAVALLIGLGALVPLSVSAFWVVSSWKALRVNQKWLLCCKLRCSS